MVKKNAVASRRTVADREFLFFPSLRYSIIDSIHRLISERALAAFVPWAAPGSQSLEGNVEKLFTLREVR